MTVGVAGELGGDLGFQRLDCRARFPEPQALICLAGAAPSTRQSGKHKAVTFRWAVSKQLRDAVCDFADGSRHASPWAARILEHLSLVHTWFRARSCAGWRLLW